MRWTLGVVSAGLALVIGLALTRPSSHTQRYEAALLCQQIIADAGNADLLATRVRLGQLSVEAASTTLGGIAAELEAEASRARADSLDDIATATSALEAAVNQFAIDFPSQDPGTDLADTSRVGRATNALSAPCAAASTH